MHASLRQGPEDHAVVLGHTAVQALELCGVDPRTALARIDAFLPESRRYVSDLGRFYKVWKYLHAYQANSFTHTAHFGSIGLGLGTGIGAALGDTSRLTVLLVGDGGFMQYAQELSTAVNLRVPLLVLVFNDSAYGIEYRKLAEFGDDPRHCLSDRPDFAELARTLGADAVTVRVPSDLDRVADLATNLSKPCLVDIKLDPALDILAL